MKFFFIENDSKIDALKGASREIIHNTDVKARHYNVSLFSLSCWIMYDGDIVARTDICRCSRPFRRSIESIHVVYMHFSRFSLGAAATPSLLVYTHKRSQACP